MLKFLHVDNWQPAKMQAIETLNDIVNKIVDETIKEFADTNLQANDLAISLVDLTNANSNTNSDTNSNTSQTQPSIDNDRQENNLVSKTPAIANFRGEEAIFPASIVKLFYLAAVYRWLEDKKLEETPQLVQACADMIIDSSNDATHYVLDLLTDTTAGPELSPEEMAIWAEKRNAINRYFQSLGYKNINVNQKTWGEGPYGRERVFVGKEKENRNKLTTNATARLLTEIVNEQFISEERCKSMLGVMARDFTKASDDPDNQAVGFMGSCLSKGAKLWSKAGWMSTARHDAAYIELPNGLKFVLVAFISNHARDYWILPTIAKKIIRALEFVHNVPQSKLR